MEFLFLELNDFLSECLVRQKQFVNYTKERLCFSQDQLQIIKHSDYIGKHVRMHSGEREIVYQQFKRLKSMQAEKRLLNAFSDEKKLLKLI